MSAPAAGQGEVWDCELNPVTGHEQAGRRPCVVVSVDQLGRGPSGLAIVVPITRTNRNALEVQLEPPDGGLTQISFAQPYQVRTIGRDRLRERRGHLGIDALAEIIARVHLLTRAP